MSGLKVLVGLAILLGLALLYWLIRVVLTEEFLTDD